MDSPGARPLEGASCTICLDPPLTPGSGKGPFLGDEPPMAEPFNGSGVGGRCEQSPLPGAS